MLHHAACFSVELVVALTAACPRKADANCTYMLLLLRLAAATASQIPSTPASEPPILGPPIHTAGEVHEMSHTELAAELSERGASRAALSGSTDMLRLRLYQARAQLLERRNAHVVHAERVLREVGEQSSFQAFSALSLETILADDNAIFAENAGRELIASLHQNTIIGAVGGLLLQWTAVLGRITPSAALLPLPAALSSGVGRAATLSAAGCVTLALLQAVTRLVRKLASAPSFLGQKIAAVTCRDGLMGWVADAEAAAAATPAQPPPPLWLRRGVVVPVLTLAVGSSVFEEVAFRGVMLHGMHTKLRLSPWVATLISSVAFGLAHLGNEKPLVHRAIYAGWTFVGGIIFGSAYLGTRGGYFVPMLLHFLNNVVVFGTSAAKVARRMLVQQQAYQAIAQRVMSERPDPRAAAGAATGGGGAFGAPQSTTREPAATHAPAAPHTARMPQMREPGMAELVALLDGVSVNRLRLD